MGMWFYLAQAAEAAMDGATAAAEAAEGGLIETLLDANVINLVIIWGVLIYFGRGFLGSMLAERKSGIETAIAEAEAKSREAAETMAAAKQKLAEVQQEIERIRATGQETAQKAKERILAEGEREVERIKSAAVQDLDGERKRAVAEIRQAIARQTMSRVEQQLREQLDDAAQRKLIDRSLTQLGQN